MQTLSQLKWLMESKPGLRVIPHEGTLTILGGTLPLELKERVEALTLTPEAKFSLILWSTISTLRSRGPVTGALPWETSNLILTVAQTEAIESLKLSLTRLPLLTEDEMTEAVQRIMQSFSPSYVVTMRGRAVTVPVPQVGPSEVEVEWIKRLGESWS